MKIYDISDTRKFFEKLNNCRGEIELVDGQSGLRQLLQTPVRQTLYPFSTVQGTISQIELIFHDHQDFDSIFRWVLNKGTLG